MKPLGPFLAIFETPRQPMGIDDDYDWHLQQAESQRRAAEPTRRGARASMGDRIVALARRSLARTESQAARRA